MGEMSKYLDELHKKVEDGEKFRENCLNALVSVYDYLKLVDNDIIYSDTKVDMLEINEETLSEMLFRKLGAYDIDLNKELGWTHLKPKVRKHE